MLLPAIAAAFVFLAIVLAAASVLRAGGRPADARIRELAGGRAGGTGLASIPFRDRVILPVVEAIGGAMASLLPGAFLGRVEQRLIEGGEPMKPATFHATMIAVGIAASLTFAALLLTASNGANPAVVIALAVIVGFPAAYIPVFWLSAQARGRRREVLKGLPDSLDLLTVCVEAGLGLDAAFHRVVEKQSGPLVDEMRYMLRQIGLGKVRREALFGLAERTGVDDVRSFVLAVIQAEQLGTGVAQVLRAQSDRVRMRRRQRAEQDARRAPVKMVFPLVFCLMPSLFIFILGPIILNVMEFLSES